MPFFDSILFHHKTNHKKIGVQQNIRKVFTFLNMVHNVFGRLLEDSVAF